MKLSIITMCLCLICVSGNVEAKNEIENRLNEINHANLGYHKHNNCLHCGDSYNWKTRSGIFYWPLYSYKNSEFPHMRENISPLCQECFDKLNPTFIFWYCLKYFDRNDIRLTYEQIQNLSDDISDKKHCSHSQRMEYEFYDKKGNLVSIEKLFTKPTKRENMKEWKRLQKMYKTGRLKDSGEMVNKRELFNK